MIELHIQSYTDREKMVMALVNNGFTVKVVEKPDPKCHWGKLYYVLIMEESPIEMYEKVKSLFADYVRKAREVDTEKDYHLRVHYNGYIKGIQEVVNLLVPELKLDPDKIS